MRIASYNVNGIRAALKKDLAGWIAQSNLDVIGFQETKAHPEQVDCAELEALGYKHHWVSAEKKGYSGVALFHKDCLENIVEGTGIPEIDNEGRVIRADYNGTTIINTYFPSGSSGDARQEVKMWFLDVYYDWIQELKKTQPNIIQMGDYNIAHTEMDIHNPKTNKNSSGFKPEEREWMTKWFASGFHDAFRVKHPELVEYSWWTYRMGARGKNKGWRIDYQSVSDSLVDKVNDCRQINDAVHSDHCPVLLDINL